MATYKKSVIMKALSFWKTKLDESKKKTVESEEDQKKEAAKEQADEEQAEIDAADEGTDDEKFDFNLDADLDQAADDDSEKENVDDDKDVETSNDSEGDSEGDSEDDESEDANSEDDSEDNSEDKDDSEDDSEDEDKDDSEDADEDADEVDSEDEDEDEDADEDDSEDEDADEDEGENDDSEFKIEITAPSKKLLDAIPDLCKKFGSKVSITVAGLDSEGDDKEGGYVTTIECQDEETLNAVKEEDAVKEAVGGMDGELNESLQYEPNTVGAVIKLLSKSDPRDFLFIRLAPNMKQCMIYDIDRENTSGEQGTTYLEIAIGNPNAS